MAFIIIGFIGLGVLLLSVVIGDLFDVSGHFDGVLDSDIFSTAAVASFLGAFGFAGYVAHAVVGPLWLAIVIGLAVGLAVGYGAIRLTRSLQRDGDTPSLNTSTMVGLPATVISTIPTQGYGEIRINVGGQPLKINARSHLEIPQGTEVWVSGVLSATAVEVRSTQEIEPPEFPGLQA